MDREDANFIRCSQCGHEIYEGTLALILNDDWFCMDCVERNTEEVVFNGYKSINKGYEPRTMA